MTIWLDVTTILAWGRPALGVVRVEAETARHFLDTGDPEIRFCQFLGGRGYSEVGCEIVRANLARLDGRGSAPPSPSPEHSSAAMSPAAALESGEQRLKRRIHGLLVRLPARYRDRVYRFAFERREAYRGFARAYREAQSAMSALTKGSAPRVGNHPSADVSPGTMPPAKAAPFAAGDVYVSLGLDWDQKDLPYLYQLKGKLGLKVLLFCHDVIPILFPHWCRVEVAAAFPRYTVDLAWCADSVLCNSERSRRDLRRFLESVGAPIPNLAVVRLGCEIAAGSVAPTSREVADVLEDRFVLFVSTIERRKNHEALYRAYTRLVDDGHPDLPLLVFVGMPGWGVNDLLSDLHSDPRIRPYVRILNHVTDGDLALLYEGAYLTLYPSLYEGWGLPVAESLAHGKLCIASDAGPLPEVGGELVEYIDPWDIPAWAQRLKWWFYHPGEVREREAAVRSRFRATTWTETAQAIFAAANSLR